MANYKEAVEAFKELQFDIRKGTDDFKRRILKLTPRIIDDYSRKVLMDNVDNAAIKVNQEGDYKSLQNAVNNFNQRLFYIAGLEEKDKEQKESIDDVAKRGSEYISKTLQLRDARESIPELTKQVNNLERKLAA